MVMNFSDVKVGKAFRDYDDYDGVRYYIKVSDKGAVCAFDYFDVAEDYEPIIYTYFALFNGKVDTVSLTRAKKWASGENLDEPIERLKRELKWE